MKDTFGAIKTVQIAGRSFLIASLPALEAQGHLLSTAQDAGLLEVAEAVALIREALSMDDDHWLYGRCNVIVDRNDQVLARVVEILPTMDQPKSPS